MLIVLASSSKYRRKLLRDVGIKAKCISPDCDESHVSESELSPVEVAEERALLKARSVAEKYPNDIIIGSDQLAHIDGAILGKPGSKAKAIKQLKQMNGKTHELLTSVAVILGEIEVIHTDRTQLSMKQLTDAQIKRYVELDSPLDCAGSYKFECNGIWLFKKILSQDQTSIQGLPMIVLLQVIEKLGYRHF